MEQLTEKFITSEKLPLVIQPRHRNITLVDLLERIANNKEYFQKELLKHGGLLFRNFPIDCEKDFVSVIRQLEMGEFFDYIGGDSPRKKVIDGVYTSTEAPPNFKIPLHNELSYVKNYPKHIYFYCETPSKGDGQTILCDARKIYEELDPDVRERFTSKGLKYTSCYPYKCAILNAVNKSHKSWSHVFETHNREEVEAKCQEHDFEFKWRRSDWIELAQRGPSVVKHPETGEKVWFNQAHIFDFNPKLLNWWRYLGTKLLYARKHTLLHRITFEDGTKIPRKDLYHILDVLDRNTVRFLWKKRDLLVLDNILTMHGRATFKGRRRILTAMTG